jgi:hypothetical protein
MEGYAGRMTLTKEEKSERGVKKQRRKGNTEENGRIKAPLNVCGSQYRVVKFLCYKCPKTQKK